MPVAAAAGYDVVVVGCGIAGVSAALSASQADPAARVLVVERAPFEARGGSSRWTAATLRLEDDLALAPGFVDEMARCSGGRADRHYFAALERALPETLDWLRSLGVELRHATTIFLTQAAERQIPVGLGRGVLEAIAAVAERLGVEFCYETTAVRLLAGEDRGVAGVVVRAGGRSPAGAGSGEEVVRCGSVVLASGGFEGNPELLAEHVGGDVAALRQLSPGGLYNTGEGIEMALELGAARGGEWGAFHGEPVDPRSDKAEAVVMVFPYGILVNAEGERFLDEGSDLADEMCEHVARAIWAQPGGVAWFVGDQRLYEVPGFERALLTDQPPVTAGSVAELAGRLSIDPARLEATVAAFNAAVAGGEYRPDRLDGKRTVGLDPPKSNWALPVDAFPLVAYPIACAIVFTFGGLATSPEAEVLDSSGSPVRGLYAAGECTGVHPGVYPGVYPGSTSVMRSLVFGRIAGRTAVQRSAASAGRL